MVDFPFIAYKKAVKMQFFFALHDLNHQKTCKTVSFHPDSSTFPQLFSLKICVFAGFLRHKGKKRPVYT